ncbi:hypothetical protein [Streptomyces hokutonensis]|uniref:hypothetical protein n=1 Tax=Streptomyces hokutonensis TaxID=1306990 RepID=UPI0036C86985
MFCRHLNVWRYSIPAARWPRACWGGSRAQEFPDPRAEIITDIGAKVTPEQAGLPLYGGERRRVTGLRRGEVTLLAGISSEHYTRLLQRLF